ALWGVLKMKMRSWTRKYNIMVAELRGLESVKRFTGPTVEIDANAERAIHSFVPQSEEDNGPKEFTIAKLSTPLSLEKENAWQKLPPLMIPGKGTGESAVVKMAYTRDALFIEYKVVDRSPWKNEGKDFRRLFKTGDGVDLQISALDKEGRPNPAAGDSRLFFSQLGDEPTAILMRPIDKVSTPSLSHTYDSSVGPKTFDRVEVRDDVEILAHKTPEGYLLRAEVPWTLLNITPEPGMTLYGDVGFISSDQSGQINLDRTYWSNPQTGLVSDEPLEAWFIPQNWGTFTLEK
ncbi:MAG: hypothetical protein ACQKBT_06435, partial [Puniceicoccales bacterium]